MRILFMGTPDFAASSLSALYEMEEVEIVGVFTQPDKPVGRNPKDRKKMAADVPDGREALTEYLDQTYHFPDLEEEE